MTAPLFPYLPGLTFPLDRSPIWDTVRQQSVSGKVSRFSNRTQPQYAYSLQISGLDATASTYPGLGAYTKQALEYLFNATQGGAGVFYFWDVDDNACLNNPLGIGNGTQTKFQLYRTTAAGWNDAIFAPVLAGGSVIVQQGGSGVASYGAPTLYANGSPISSSAYSISSAGLVTFNAAPAGGVALNWTGSFWWPCNFDDDTLRLSKIMGGLWECPKINFTTRIY